MFQWLPKLAAKFHLRWLKGKTQLALSQGRLSPADTPLSLKGGPKLLPAFFNYLSLTQFLG